MKNFFLYVFLIIFFNNFSYSEEWKIQNKWKISCGLVDKEALVVNGEPIKRYSKKEFKVKSVIFKISF